MSDNNEESKKKLEPINKNKALVEAKINTMIKNGRTQIKTIGQLKDFKKGSLISYMNTNKIYKSGGFVWKVNDDNFIYLNLDTGQKIRVKIENVEKMWVGSVFAVKNDIVSIVPTPNKKTTKPVMVNDVVVYYAKDSYDYNRYICTSKHKLMKKWSNIFN
jgi:hypothetical protein